MESTQNTDNTRVFEFLKNRCNNIIFKGNFNQNMTLDDLKKQFEYQGINPTIFTQKLFIKYLEKEFTNKNINLSPNAIKGLVNEAVKHKFLKRWGEDNAYLVTPEFLDYIRSLESPYIRFDLETFVGEDLEIQTIECPYCTDQTRFPTEEGFFEVKCEKCAKDFKLVTGTVRKMIDATSEISKYHENPQPTTSITLLIKESQRTVNLQTANPILAEKNDKISLIYTKGILYDNYSNMPHKIANLTSSQIYKL